MNEKIFYALEKETNAKRLDIYDLEFVEKFCQDLLDKPLVDQQSLDDFQSRREDLQKHYISEDCQIHILYNGDVVCQKTLARKSIFDEKITPAMNKWKKKLDDKFLEETKDLILNSDFKFLRKKSSFLQDVYTEKNEDLVKEEGFSLNLV